MSMDLPGSTFKGGRCYSHTWNLVVSVVCTVLAIFVIEGMLLGLALLFNRWYYLGVGVWPLFMALAFHTNRVQLTETRRQFTEHVKIMVAPWSSHGSWPGTKASHSDSNGLREAALKIGETKLTVVQNAHASNGGEETDVSMDMETAALGLPRFSYQELANATDSFAYRVGQNGRSSSDYKGVHPSTGQSILVRKLSLSACDALAVASLARDRDIEFKAKLCAGSAKHFFMVELLGYCMDGTHRLLVYEDMANGSLDRWVFGGGDMVLPWEQRISIANALAKGLVAFHSTYGGESRFLHLDLKPENILLSDSFEPKLADSAEVVEMSPSGCTDPSQILLTNKGYLAPEVVLQDMRILASSQKSHVFSYGMLLLELVSGRRNRDDAIELPERRYFPAWAQHTISPGDTEGRGDEEQGIAIRKEELALVDKRLQGKFDAQEAIKLCKLGLWCIQKDPLLRPAMAEVCELVERRSSVVASPPPILEFAQVVEESLQLRDSICSSVRFTVLPDSTIQRTSPSNQ